MHHDPTARPREKTSTHYVEFDVIDPVHAANRPSSSPFLEKHFNLRAPQKQSSIKNSWSHRWIYQELYFSMNKLSLLGMIIGLMFLGALFFTSGFLMAVNLYGIGAPPAATATNLPSHLPQKGALAQSQDLQKEVQKPISIPSQYHTVSGVNIVPSARVPSPNVQKAQRAPEAPVRHVPNAPVYVATGEPIAVYATAPQAPVVYAQPQIMPQVMPLPAPQPVYRMAG